MKCKKSKRETDAILTDDQYFEDRMKKLSEDMKDRMKKLSEDMDRTHKRDVIRTFLPICHGTDRWSAERIDKEGLKPAKKAGRSSIHIGSARSLEDRSYFASTQNWKGIDKCISAATIAARKQGGDEKDGIIYVLRKIPPDAEPAIDEDVNLGYRTKEVTDPFDSLEKISSMGFKTVIPIEYLEKMTIDEFKKQFLKRGM